MGDQLEFPRWQPALSSSRVKGTAQAVFLVCYAANDLLRGHTACSSQWAVVAG